jgi:hypothetical protein
MPKNHLDSNLPSPEKKNKMLSKSIIVLLIVVVGLGTYIDTGNNKNKTPCRTICFSLFSFSICFVIDISLLKYSYCWLQWLQWIGAKCHPRM